MVRCLLHVRAPLGAIRHWARGLVSVVVAASALLTGCSGLFSGPRGGSAGPSLPYTVTQLTPSTTGNVSEFKLPVLLPSGYTVLPASLTSGPDGALWFTEVTTGRIGRLTPSGTLTEFTLPRATTGQPSTPPPTPGSMTLGPDHALWFTILNDPPPAPFRIGRLTPSGVFTEFDLPTTFSAPSYITVGTDGALWVAGLQLQVGRLTLAGTFTAFNLPRDHLTGIYGIVGGPDGAAWFTQGHGVGRVTPSGTFTWFAQDEGRDANGRYILSPGGGITLGPDGNLWFAEFALDRIGRLNPTTGTLTTFPLPFGSLPFAITTGRDGNVWFAARSASQIGRITPDGQVTVFQIPLPPGEHPGYDDVVSVAAGPDGAIWFIQQQANEIGRLTW